MPDVLDKKEELEERKAKLLTRAEYKEIEQRRAQDDMQALLDHADATIPEEEVVPDEPEPKEEKGSTRKS